MCPSLKTNAHTGTQEHTWYVMFYYTSYQHILEPLQSFPGGWLIILSHVEAVWEWFSAAD